MPELPEVETMAADLRAAVSGKKIKKAEIFVPAMVKYPSAEIFACQIRDAKICNVSRRAKYLVFELDKGRKMFIHPKMTGHFLLVTKAQKHEITKAKEPESLKYTRIKFILDDGGELCFSDVRKFGTVRLFSKGEADEFVRGFGPEPLKMGVVEFVNLIAAQRRKIKQVLMDPGVISGIGNIYSDEALYAAGIHPEKRASEIKTYELEKLHLEIVKILKKAIRLRGSSINNYRDASGGKGGYQNVRMVYGRVGEPCSKCATPIARKVIAGRSAHFCPECQK